MVCGRVKEMEIKQIVPRWILDSRGNPTVEVDVFLADDSFGRAAVPSGASTGSHEAVELRDGGGRFEGLGVETAVANVAERIAPALIGKSASEQKLIDHIMTSLDGTPNDSSLGANAMLAVSLAVARAAAASKHVLLYAHINELFGGSKSLPMPMMNVLNGGKHAIGGSDIQETMIVPHGAPSFKEVIRIGSEIFHELGSLLHEKGQSTQVGDEGGYAPAFAQYVETLDTLMAAIERAGYAPGKDVSIAIDVASTELYKNNTYRFAQEERTFGAGEMIGWYESLITRYPIVSIEDGLSEDAWDDWKTMNNIIGSRVQLVGDDFLVTNSERLQKAIDTKSANAILIKPNQIGTLSQTLDTIKLAQESGWRTIVSHRSGETEDVTLAHIAVGTNSGQVKTGSMSRSDRIAKYNELLRLEEADPGLTLANPFAASS